MTIQVYSKALLTKDTPRIAMPAGLELRKHVREVEKLSNGHQIYEFIGTDTFGDEWQQRQQFEIDAGRDEEPILYTPLYDEVRDAGLPKNVPVQRLGPGGAVLKRIYEGGEVEFMTIESSEFSVPILHYGVGLEYSKDLVMFNQLWDVSVAERAVGIAYNALLNHIHLSPIIDFTYTAANQTAANTAGATTVEDHLLTLEDAITNSKADATNPRRGPFYLLIASAEEFVIDKALRAVAQEGVSLQSQRALSQIRGVIVYDGWSGTMGGQTTTYSGVSAGTGYLISQQYRGQDFRSYIKQDLLDNGEEMDISRLMTQKVWDTYFGVYNDIDAAVEEITWP